MVKPIAKAEINTLTRGILSEASPLNFPAEASRDEENFELNRDGTRSRRLGIDFEPDYQLRSTGYNENALKTVAVSTFRWLNAGNNTLNEFSVIQFGNHIDIYDITKTSISRDGYKDSVTLTGVDASIRFSYASVDGKLVIAAGNDTVHIVSYNGTTFTYTTGRLQVRDLWGLPGNDGNDINTRPTVKTDAHIYNLQNQGWGIPRKDSAGTLSDPINVFFASFSKYPANSEVVYTGLEYQPVTSGTAFERIYPNMYDDRLGLDSRAAKGYYIIDVLKRGTSRITAFNANKSKFSLSQTLTSLPADTTSGGCSVLADFAGRVFYAGFEGAVTDGDANSPNLSSYILFSQVVKSTDDIFKCYQQGDPTSREASDILDTDGGFIRISGVKKIYNLVVQSNNLFVIADNGIWVVYGGSDFGFTATNYVVNKISSYGCTNSKSVVIVNDQIFFWGTEGIFMIAKNQYGDWVVTNLSEPTIQRIYDAIEDLDKRSAFGIYDAIDKQIRWIYNIDTDRTNANIVRELVINTSVNAFTKTRIYSLESASPEVIGFITTTSFTTGTSNTNVVIAGDLIQVDGEDVVVGQTMRESGSQSIKYLTLYSSVGGNIGYTFSQYQDLTFKDWYSVNSVGADAKGYILFGQVTAGDSSIAKQSPYLVMHFRRTEEDVELEDGSLIPSKQSSCFVRSQWDWANSINSGKWSPLFQTYRYRRPYFITSSEDAYDSGYETIVSKSKLRGRGRAISLYLETEPEKDCQILGWSLSLTGNNLA